MLATMLLNAEGTSVSSYTSTIDEQMTRINDGTTEVKVKENRQQVAEQKDQNAEEQVKWDRLTDLEKHKIEANRTQKRDEGLVLINKRMEELNDEARKLADKKSAMMNKEKFDQKQKMIDQKKSKLSEMKGRLERAPAGRNVDLESADWTRDESKNEESMSESRR